MSHPVASIKSHSSSSRCDVTGPCHVSVSGWMGHVRADHMGRAGSGQAGGEGGRQRGSTIDLCVNDTYV